MTKEEAERVLAALAIYFPGRIPPATLRAWAVELEPFTAIDAENGMRRLARESKNPNLSELIECIKAERKERVRWAAMRQPPLLQLVHKNGPDAESELRTRIAQEVASDAYHGRIPIEGQVKEVARRLSMAREKEKQK